MKVRRVNKVSGDARRALEICCPCFVNEGLNFIVHARGGQDVFETVG